MKWSEMLFRWAQGVWPCGICLEEVPGSKCARLACRHAFCTSCMQAHCRLHIKEGSLDQLRCPVPDCKRPFEPEASAKCIVHFLYTFPQRLTLGVSSNLADVQELVLSSR